MNLAYILIAGGCLVLLGVFVECFRSLVRGCPHERAGWPQNGVQRCWACGCERDYPELGGKPGPWHRRTP